MLERTAGCLESGSLRRLLPASKKAMKSRRTLHSSFWTHGASDLETSSLWTALVQIAAPAEQLGGRDVQQQQRPAALGNAGLLLDFLYPAGTLNLLRQYSGWGLDRTGGRLARNGLEKFGHRRFTSSAQDTTTTSNSHSSSRKAVAVEDETGAENRSMALLYEKLGLTRNYDFEEAWRQYSLLEDEEQQNLLRMPLMRYLSISERLVDAERTIQLFGVLEEEQKTPVIYRHTIRAYLKMRNLADAMRLYAMALNEESPAGAEELLAYLIKNSSWGRAFSVWNEFNNFRAQTPGLSYNIFEVLDTDPTIGSQAIELAGYVNRKLDNQSPDSASDVPPELLNFASRIVRRALLSTQAFNSARFTSLLTILEDWKLISPALYEQVNFMLLRLNETKLAIKCYRRIRHSKEFRFTRPTLHSLLKICCDYHSVLGMQQILDDFFRIYSRPTRTAYRMCMSEFAAQGDAETVHALFDQLLERDDQQRLTSVSEITPVLHVHAKRGEVREVVTYFDQIQDIYRLQPNLLCWNILINAYGKVHDVDRAYDCFEQLISDGNLQPDHYTFGTMMGICTTRGDIDRVIGLYMFAQEQKIEISAAMLDCLVLAHVQARNLQKAEAICEDALKMDIKGSRTRMWNYLLTGHALNRNLVDVNRLLQRMSEADIEYDTYTYSALMQSLVMVKQPDRAFAVMTDVMPPAGVQATDFHYAIIMGGYLANGEIDKVFKLQRRMEKRNVRTSASTKLLTLKATVADDEKLLEDGSSEEKLNRALEMFQEIVTSMDPQDIASPARKGINRLPADIAYSTMFNRYMIFILGRYAEFSTADSIYEAYLRFLPASRKNQVPLDMLRTIMEIKSREGDHETVRQCWEASLAQAKRLGKPIEAEFGKLPEDHLIQNERHAIDPARQMDLARHLGLYMQSLHTQRMTDKMIATVNGLLNDGFALDNHNWNSYIEFLTKRNKYQLAFRLCETYLMDQWTGWARIRWTLPERNRLPTDLRAKRKDPLHLRPKYLTILHLARGYLELQSMAAESVHSGTLLTELERDCPRVVRAITTMQRVDDYLERTVLRGY
ncbi:hypothetical protein ONS95_000880 [Cadophora gregata]|uniref:uncharacterized protein n=1 Tax=Cadophora gregata TaxID=51156 RepID=UPI0026DCC2AC|nr:uncharacterized protein ONS95_000880 [Cadophora gregata]KAK0128936.1 hypothetical protein ONS95_000880 [Cadophora gregata]